VQTAAELNEAFTSKDYIPDCERRARSHPRTRGLKSQFLRAFCWDHLAGLGAGDERVVVLELECLEPNSEGRCALPGNDALVFLHDAEIGFAVGQGLRNASATEPAKAIGFQYAAKGQPLQTNAP
jgi:hypothetical protein